MRIILVLIAAFALLLGCIASPEEKPPGDLADNGNGATGQTMTKDEALDIAKGSEYAAEGEINDDDIFYNENSKTWWIGYTPSEAKPGCNPALVVSEGTKAVEINWRCTGALPPEPPEKEAEFISCPEGERVDYCTMEYNPVCGKAGEEMMDFGNPCMACSQSGNASGYYIGTCEENGL